MHFHTPAYTFIPLHTPSYTFVRLHTPSYAIHPPWIDTDIKRLIRKRNKYFTIKNKTRSPRDINHYKALKREVQRRIRQNCWSYVEEIFTPTDSSDNNSCVSKRFWSFTKHARNDKTGVATLKLQST